MKRELEQEQELEEGEIYEHKDKKQKSEVDPDSQLTDYGDYDDDNDDDQTVMNSEPVEVDPAIDTFINDMVEDIPEEYKEDNIYNDNIDKIKLSLDKIADNTHFSDFLNIINKARTNYVQTAINHINSNFLTDTNIKNVNTIGDLPSILNKPKATPLQLLQLSLALAHLTILRLRVNPVDETEKNTNKVMQCMYALKIYVLSERGFNHIIMKMFQSRNMTNFKNSFDEFMEHIFVTNAGAAESVGTLELIQSISNLQDDFRGVSAALPPGSNDTVASSITSNATSPETVKTRAKLILTHLLFQSQADEDSMKKILKANSLEYKQEKVEDLKADINIFQLSSEWLGGLTEYNKSLSENIESKINHLGASIVATNGVVPGGKGRKTRRIKRTRKANKKNKRNSKKGRKMNQTKRR